MPFRFTTYDLDNIVLADLGKASTLYAEYGLRHLLAQGSCVSHTNSTEGEEGGYAMEGVASGLELLLGGTGPVLLARHAGGARTPAVVRAGAPLKVAVLLRDRHGNDATTTTGGGSGAVVAGTLSGAVGTMRADVKVGKDPKGVLRDPDKANCVPTTAGAVVHA